MKHIVQRIMGNGVRVTEEGSWKHLHDAEITARLLTTATGVEHAVVTTGTNFLGAYDDMEEECTRA